MDIVASMKFPDELIRSVMSVGLDSVAVISVIVLARIERSFLAFLSWRSSCQDDAGCHSGFSWMVSKVLVKISLINVSLVRLAGAPSPCGGKGLILDISVGILFLVVL